MTHHAPDARAAQWHCTALRRTGLWISLPSCVVLSRRPPLPFPAPLRKERGVTEDRRIISVDLDEASIVWRNADVEQERRVAIFDLLEDNRFVPQRGHDDGYAGPYRLKLRVEEGRLVFEIARENRELLEAVILGLGRFRRPIRDYFAICDSYYQAIRSSTAQQIETVDMARRALHNEGAEMLVERLDGKIAVDFDTARRLFTLICVLHIKG
jgi:uncharacterized protein (UPF0262 family)